LLQNYVSTVNNGQHKLKVSINAISEVVNWMRQQEGIYKLITVQNGCEKRNQHEYRLEFPICFELLVENLFLWACESDAIFWIMKTNSMNLDIKLWDLL
jgi:hypothetical protein